MAEVYSTCSGFVILSDEFVTIDKNSGKHITISYSQIKSVEINRKCKRVKHIIISLIVCIMALTLTIPAIIDIITLVQRQKCFIEKERGDGMRKELFHMERRTS